MLIGQNPCGLAHAWGWIPVCSFCFTGASPQLGAGSGQRTEDEIEGGGRATCPHPLSWEYVHPGLEPSSSDPQHRESTVERALLEPQEKGV